MGASPVVMGGEPMDYASSGVDIDAEGRAISSLIDALGGSVRKVGQKGAPVPLPGGFGGIVEFGDSRPVSYTHLTLPTILLV